MPRVVEERGVDGCLESTPVREFVLAGPVDESTMHRLAGDGRLKFYPHFPRPFFRVDVPHAYSIQGFVGADTLRVTLLASAPPGVSEVVRRRIEGEGPGETGSEGGGA